MKKIIELIKNIFKSFGDNFKEYTIFNFKNINKKIDLFEENLLWATIKSIYLDEFNFWIWFEWNMILNIESKYMLQGSSKDDYSDLIWLQITNYKRNKSRYLLSLWKGVSIEISRKEEDWKSEILQLGIGNEDIIDNWD